MNNKSQFDIYVTKAQEAEQQAEKTRNPKEQAAWRKIAANYRDLAMMAQYSARTRRVRPTKH